MAFDVRFLRDAKKDLEALPKHIFRQIEPRLRALATEPKPLGGIKLKGSENSYRVRSGDYRILYEIDDSQKIVTVFAIKHRKDAYR